MIAAIFVLVIALGAVVAGAGHVRKARAMRGWRATTGRVTGRDVVAIPGGTREGRWGQGGGYVPRITYAYAVDGVERTGDRGSYALRGLKRAVAEQRAAAYPDEVQVWYDPADPGEAYLERHAPGLGWILVIGGAVAALAAIAVLASGG